MYEESELQNQVQLAEKALVNLATQAGNNALTIATLRASLDAAQEEVEQLKRRIAELEAPAGEAEGAGTP